MFFIGANGKVYMDIADNVDKERLDTESFGLLNLFSKKRFATFVRDTLEDYHPRIYYDYGRLSKKSTTG